METAVRAFLDDNFPTFESLSNGPAYIDKLQREKDESEEQVRWRTKVPRPTTMFHTPWINYKYKIKHVHCNLY